MNHRAAVSTLVAVFLLALFPPLPLLAQEAPVSPDDGWEGLESFGEQISVEVVNLQVWVTDDQGSPVTGLAKEDFEVYEDGEPVEITNFAAYEGSGEVGEDPEAGEPSTPEIAPETRLEVSDEPAGGEAPGGAEERRLHLTVLVDNWSIRPGDRARIFQDLREFLAGNLEAGDRVAVAVHDGGLQLVQRFTERPADVVRALGRVENLAPRGIQLASERRSALQAIEREMRLAEEVSTAFSRGPGQGEAQVGGACERAIGGMQAAAQGYAAAVQGNVQSSASALATLTRVLSGVPGRRVVLYVGNGLAQNPGQLLFEHVGELCPNQRSQLAGFQHDYDMTWLYEEVAAHANAAGVTLYTLESESPAVDLGLDGPGGGTDSTGAGRSFRPSTHLLRVEELDEEASLVLLARQTGGRSILNASDLTGDFRRIAVDMRTYYSLGFTPRDPGDGELHRLEVKLTDGEGYRVRHRLRYRDKPAAERMAERVQGVAQFGTEVNPLDVKVEIGESFPAGDGSFRVAARIWVPFEHLTLLAADGADLRGRIRVLLATTDGAGQLQPVRQKVVPLEVSVPEGQPRPPGEHLVEVQLTLPPGDHHVALGVRDDLGGQTSYVRERFRVPTAGMVGVERGL